MFSSIGTINGQIKEVPGLTDILDNDKPVKPKLLKEYFPKATLLYTRDKGRVYALPQDNMPCLAPYINSNIPLAKLDIDKYKKIPNPLPQQKVIPNLKMITAGKKNKKNPLE